MEAMGVGPEAIRRFLEQGMKKAQLGDFLVHPDNEAAVRLFNALQTQWRITAVSGLQRAAVIRTGLDYAAIDPTARMLRLELQPEDLVRLQDMEVEAIAAWAEERGGQ